MSSRGPSSRPRSELFLEFPKENSYFTEGEGSKSLLQGSLPGGIRISANISVFQTEETSSTLVSRTIRCASLTHGKPFYVINIVCKHKLGYETAQRITLFTLSLSKGAQSKGPLIMINEELQSWYVYMCESRALHYYVGITPNPEKRIEKHNSGNGSKMAKDQGRFKLVYVSKPFPDKSAARKREIQLKGWTRKKKEKLISGDWE